MAQQKEKETHEMINDIFQAIDTIVSTRVDQLQFDKTIKCQIIDDSNSDLGEYTVTNGTTDFIAYTDNQQLRVGNWVFVTIPNNDFSQQKIITGKYTSEDTEYYTYVNPLNTYVNMTGNLVNSTVGVKSLIANHPTEKEVIIESIGDCNVYTNAEYTEDSIVFSNFDRLAIQANFRSELSQYNLVSGHYGLSIRIKSFIPSVNEANGGYTTWTKLKLDSANMFGNPYNFFSDSTQQCIFDISEIGNIVGIIISFYQDNDFTAGPNKRIPIITEEDDAEIIQSAYLSKSNLFVNNVFVSLGYDLSNFDTDTVLLHTFNSPTYKYTLNGPNNGNNKRIYLNWIHLTDDEEIKVIDEIADIPISENSIPLYDIHWYQWRFANNVENPIAGTFWQEIESNINHFQYELEPSDAVEVEKIKVIIQSPSESYIERTIADMDYLLEDETEEEKVNRLKEAEVELKSEIVYYESNILEFTNEQEIANIASVNLVRGLELICDEEYGKGVYRIYDTYGQLLNKHEGIRERKIIARFDSVVLRDESRNPEYKITWYIPATETMIADPEVGIKEGKYYVYTPSDSPTPITDTENQLQTVEFYLPFKIKNFYNKTWTNNTIKCVIERGGIKYTAECTLLFSTASSNGTEYALAADFSGFIDNQYKNLGSPIFYIDKNNYKLKITPHVFDNNGIEKTDINLHNISYRLYNTWQNKFQITKDESTGEGILSLIDSYDETNRSNYYHCIVELTVSRTATIEQENSSSSSTLVDLTEYIPIAVCYNSAHVKGLIGDNRIIYDYNGTNPQYYKSPYQLLTDNSDDTITWYMHLGNDNGITAVKCYYPTIDKNTGELTPPSIFMSGNKKTVSIIAERKAAGSTSSYITWCQPLYITQDKYASKFLNSWDGSMVVDKTDNRIMSAMIGAGVKNTNDNTFSGIIMGDLASKLEGGTIPMGLYGFNHGEQSYGFKVDGTAFIGKSGKGQIIFNGNEGKIESGNYSMAQGTGMLIHLTEGNITIPLKKDANNNSQGIIGLDSKATTYPFQVGNKLRVDWDGNVYVEGVIRASNGTFNGEINALTGELGETSHVDGKIHIGTTQTTPAYGYIYSGNHSSINNTTNTGFYLSGEGLSIGSYFKVDEQGNLSAKSGTIGNGSGTNTVYINSGGGIFSGSHNTFANTASGFYLGADGLSIGRYFSVDYDGNLTATSLSIGWNQLPSGIATTTQVDDAKTKATNYLYFDSTNGLYIAQNVSAQNAAPSSNYVRITSTGIHSVYNSTNYSLLDSEGLKVWQDGSRIAKFGKTILLGQTGENHENVFVGVNDTDDNDSQTNTARMTFRSNTTTKGGIIWYNQTNDLSPFEIFVRSNSSTNGCLLLNNRTNNYSTIYSSIQLNKEDAIIDAPEIYLAGGNVFIEKKVKAGNGVFSNNYCYVSDGGSYRGLKPNITIYDDEEGTNLFDNSLSMVRIDSNNIHFSDGDAEGTYIHKVYNKSVGTSARAVKVSSGHLFGTTEASSQRYKNHISLITETNLNPHLLYNINVSQFKYNDNYLIEGDQRENIFVPGFIAEQVYEHYPIAVDLDDQGRPDNWNERYIIPPMLALIQEQHKEIEQLKQQVEALINR